MDLISAHRQGLIEQLDEEVAALAGRPCDHRQRAIVLHHLYDHSRGNHLWALAEAWRSLRIGAGLEALGRSVDRWGWIGARRQAAGKALKQMAEELGEAQRRRTIAAYRVYRMTGIAALRDEPEANSARDLLMQGHAARRAGSSLMPEARQALADEVEAIAAAAVAQAELAVAWGAIDATALRRAAHRLIGDKALARLAAMNRRRGAESAERALRSEPSLPASFRANPAQHFYALQQQLRERRRQQWREACDREPDAFELAA